jgi:hypothetical protein
MSSVVRMAEYRQRYRVGELLYLRRTILVVARAMPIGAKRNEKRQIASSLRALVRNEEWLAEHTIQWKISERVSSLHRQ